MKVSTRKEVDTRVMEEDGQKLRVTDVHPSGRRSFDPVSKARLIESCLQPGASVAQLALDHGINANLLWKWIQKHRLAKKEPLPTAPSSTPAFIPVHIEATAERVLSRPARACALDLQPNTPTVRLSEPAGTGPLSSPAKMSASLPNGVTLTLECGDVQAVTAIIGALGDVQAGR